eukprot:1374598-Amorphochlora_amoeboformis.AAC.1
MPSHRPSKTVSLFGHLQWQALDTYAPQPHHNAAHFSLSELRKQKDVSHNSVHSKVSVDYQRQPDVFSSPLDVCANLSNMFFVYPANMEAIRSHADISTAIMASPGGH